MIIRPATVFDVRAVHHLVSDMEGEELDYDRFRLIFEAFLKRPGCFSRVAELDGEVLGCLNLRLEDQAHHVGPIAEIMELAVKDGCRSSGLGRALVAEAKKIARAGGCLQLEVCCKLHRERAHDFYQRQGLGISHYKLTCSLEGDGD